MNATQVIVVAVIVGLLVYDAFAGKLGQPTESQVLKDWARRWNLLPFVAGFLLGHWFGPTQHPWASGWMWGLPVMGAILGIDIYWNVAQRPDVVWRYPLWWALLGVPCGMVLWGQPAGWGL